MSGDESPEDKNPFDSAESDETDDYYDSDDEDGENDVYDVESILKHRQTDDGSYQYFVKWEGFAVKDATWEDDANLDGCRKLVDDYNRQHHIETSPLCLVEAILKHRRSTNGHLEYNVKWQGYPIEKASWIKEEDFSAGCHEMLVAYKRKHTTTMTKENGVDRSSTPSTSTASTSIERKRKWMAKMISQPSPFSDRSLSPFPLVSSSKSMTTKENGADRSTTASTSTASTSAPSTSTTSASIERKRKWMAKRISQPSPSSSDRSLSPLVSSTGESSSKSISEGSGVGEVWSVTTGKHAGKASTSTASVLSPRSIESIGGEPSHKRPRIVRKKEAVVENESESSDSSSEESSSDSDDEDESDDDDNDYGLPKAPVHECPDGADPNDGEQPPDTGAETGFDRGWTAQRVLGVTKYADGSLWVLVSWTNGETPEMLLNTVVNEKAPQVVIDYYSKSLHWKRIVGRKIATAKKTDQNGK